MKISIRGTVVGVVLAAIYIFLLVYLPNLTGQFLKGLGADVSGTITTIFLSSTAIALAVALSILAIPNRAIKEAPRVTGIAKVLQGVVFAAYYYVILNGGTISISLLYSNVQLVLSVTLIITLALLELSAVMTILQGIFEAREHVPVPEGSSVASAPVTTSGPSQ